MVSYLTAAADNVYNSNMSSLPNPGTTTNPVVNVINGNADLGPSSWPGAGVLLITGDVTWNGWPQYSGVILVVGTGRVTVSGGGNGQINGGILVANTTTCPTSLGPTFVNFNGGGTMTIQYDTNWTQPLNGFLPYQILSFNY